MDAPINVGATGQTKGSYFVATQLLSSIDITSPKYCIGTDCITSWPGTPSGAVVAFNLSSCPVGWQIADGTNGTVDLRGYFLRGLNTNSSGVDAGRTPGSVQQDDFKAHSHLTPTTSGVVQSSENGREVASWTRYGYDYIDGQNPDRESPPTSVVGGIETRPKNVALLYCQKI